MLDIYTYTLTIVNILSGMHCYHNRIQKRVCTTNKM